MRRVDVPPNLLTDVEAGDELELPSQQVHYLRDVLRLQEGDEVELFDGDGRVAHCRIIDMEATLGCELLRVGASERGESPLFTVLFQAIPKGKRWKWILEKATELGVNAIIPLQTERTVVQIPKRRLEGRLERWEKILASATRQCQRTVVPQICAPMTIEEARRREERDIDLVAHPGGDEAPTPGRLLQDLDSPPGTVGIWIGPEGGFTDGEVCSMTEAGMKTVSLGRRILRADTAGIAALTLVQAAMGDLGARYCHDLP